MADNAQFKMLDRATVTSNEKGTALDLLAYKTLYITAQVISSTGQTGEALVIEHAAVDEDSVYAQLGSVDLGTTGTQSFETSSYSRSVRWKTGTLTNPAVVDLTVIAKES